MTEPGTLGRSAPGESWKRAMALVAARHAAGSKRRYRVAARLIEPGWWVYEVSKIARDDHRPVKAAPVELTRHELAELATTLPRCAQRAHIDRGGNSKVAWPSADLAGQMARALGVRAYPCRLPAPAIGKHWHVTTTKKKARKK